MSVDTIRQSGVKDLLCIHCALDSQKRYVACFSVIFFLSPDCSSSKSPQVVTFLALFLPMKQCINLLEQKNETVLTDIPPGHKNNCYFLIDQLKATSYQRFVSWIVQDKTIALTTQFPVTV